MKKVDVTVTKQNDVDVIRYELSAADVYDDRAADKASQLSNVVPIQYGEENGKRTITAYVRETMTLEAMYKRAMSKKQVFAIMSGLVSAFEIGTQGIPISYILKDSSYIYVNEQSLTIKCVLIPVKQDVMPLAEIPAFFREIISKMMFDEGDKDNYVAKLLTLINSNDFTVSKLKNYVDEQLEAMGFFVSKENGLTGMSGGAAPSGSPQIKVNKLGVMNNIQNANRQAQMGQMPMMGQPPMGQMPMGAPGPMGAPMGQPPMGQPPIGQPPMGQPPMGQPPMGQPPMGQMPKPPVQPAPQPMGAPGPMGAPIGQPPMGQPPMGQPPMGQMPKPPVQPAPQPMGAPGPMGAPIGQPPMGQPPVGQPPMGQPPMGQMPKPPVQPAPQPMGAPGPMGAPIGQPPMGQPPVGQMPKPPVQPAPQPMGAPIGQPPVGQPPVGQPPMGQPPQPEAKPEPKPEPEIPTDVPEAKIEENAVEGLAPQDIEPTFVLQEEKDPTSELKSDELKSDKIEDVPETEVTAPIGDLPHPFMSPQAEISEMTQGKLVGQMGSKPIPHIVRKKTGEVINITKPEFSIGKSNTKADYTIEDNSAISRVHCIIVQKDGVNYIKDNNSTNHTYLNGVELSPGKEHLLKNKTVIQMGDEEFTFFLRKSDNV